MGVTSSSGTGGSKTPTWVLLLAVAAFALCVALVAKHNRTIPIGDQPSPAPSHGAASFFRELPGDVARLVA